MFDEKQRPATIDVSSVSEYISLVENPSLFQQESFVYRGVSKSEKYKLIPSLFRSPEILNEFGASEDLNKWGLLERKLLEKFKQGARQHLEKEPKDDIEWLVLARHHDLPTRVLDWSRNPLVALHFAVDAEAIEVPAVWQAILGYRANIGSSYSLNALDSMFTQNSSRLMGYHQGPTTPRATAQQGTLSVHSLPANGESFVPLDEQDPEKSGLFYLRKITVNEKHIESIRQTLVGLGISNATVFPDLDGLVKSIKKTPLRETQ